jgi:glycosyltransferase involved in cell wall biosynthesis
MILGIDTRIPTKNKAGVGYLIDNIVPLLVESNQFDSYKLVGSSLGINKKNVKTFALPKLIQRGINLLWKNIFFPPVNFLIGKTDVFLSTNFVDIPVYAKKKVLLIPDMSFKKFPQFTERKNLNFLNRNVKRAIHRSDKIITISENAKKEICEYYKIPEKKVEVVYLGCPKNIKKIDNINLIEKIKNKYGIEKKYILFVGTLEPRKNIRGLIEAYNLIDDKLRSEYQLVLCGGKGWYYEEIFDIVRRHKLEKQIVFTGYAEEEDLSSLYSGASAFIYPSFYEGFGLPLLEAFTCGVPVVCSNTSSLPEVGGDAVIYCDPGDTDSLMKSIKTVLENKSLITKNIKKGYEQLKRFSWNDSIEKILEIIKN